MAVVVDRMIGNTRAKINDEYCRDKTEEEVEEILKKVARITYPYLRAAHFAKLKEK